MAFDLALALAELGFTDEYQGSTTGNDERAFNALTWSTTPPTWEAVQSADTTNTGRPTDNERVDGEGDVAALKRTLLRLNILTRADLRQDL